MLKKIFQKKKNESHRNADSFYTKDLLINNNYSIGEYTYGIPSILEWGEGTKLTIGKFCSIADDVKIFLGGNHRTDWVSTYPFSVLSNQFPMAKGIPGHPATKGDVIIGNDVWIGYGATILSGVRIGDGAVIAANAVVTKNVDEYCIAAGNPAKTIKKRFNDETIYQLIKIAWWTWPIDKINSEIQYICNNDIQNFIKRNTAIAKDNKGTEN